MKHSDMMNTMKRMTMLRRIADEIRELKVDVRSPADRARKDEQGEELPLLDGMNVYDVKLPTTVLCDRMSKKNADMLAFRLTEAFLSISKEFEEDVQVEFKSVVGE